MLAGSSSPKRRTAWLWAAPPPSRRGPKLLDRVGIGLHPAGGTGPHDQVSGKLVQDLAEVVDHQHVPLLPPPVPHHPVGQDDEVSWSPRVRR